MSKLENDVRTFLRSMDAEAIVDRCQGQYISAVRGIPEMTPLDLEEMIRLRLYWAVTDAYRKNQGPRLDRANLIREVERVVRVGLVQSLSQPLEQVPVRGKLNGIPRVWNLGIWLILRQKEVKDGLAPEVLVALSEVAEPEDAEALACWLARARRGNVNIPRSGVGRMTAKRRRYAERVVLAITNSTEPVDPKALPRPAQALYRYLVESSS